MCFCSFYNFILKVMIIRIFWEKMNSFALSICSLLPNVFCFFFFNRFGCAGPSLLLRPSSSCESGGYFLTSVVLGFSLRWFLLLWSRTPEHTSFRVRHMVQWVNRLIDLWHREELVLTSYAGSWIRAQTCVFCIVDRLSLPLSDQKPIPRLLMLYLACFSLCLPSLLPFPPLLPLLN